MRLIATCPEETKPALVAELEALGVTELAPTFRAVLFSATPRQFYELHLRVRTASRILRVLREVPAHTPGDAAFAGATPALARMVRRPSWLHGREHGGRGRRADAETGHHAGSRGRAGVLHAVGCAGAAGRYRRAEGGDRGARDAWPLHAELRHLGQVAAQARLSRAGSSRAAERNAGGGDPAVCRVRRQRRIPRPDVRQRHAGHRGGDDRRAQGAADPSQERRISLRVARGFRPRALARNAGKHPCRKAGCTAVHRGGIRHPGRVRRDGAQERAQGARREVHPVRRGARAGRRAARADRPAGDEPAVRRSHRWRRSRGASVVRGVWRHAEAAVRWLARCRARGRCIAVQGDRAQAVANDQPDEWQHSVPVAVVRPLCRQPARAPAALRRSVRARRAIERLRHAPATCGLGG